MSASCRELVLMKIILKYHIHCYKRSTKYNLNFDMKMIYVFKMSSNIDMLWVPIGSLSQWLQCYLDCIPVFSATVSSFFSPFSSFIFFYSYPSLPLILVGLIFHHLFSSQWRHDFPSAFKNDQSHPMFYNFHYLLILLKYFCHWWLFCTSIFLHLLFPSTKGDWEYSGGGEC